MRLCWYMRNLRWKACLGNLTGSIAVRYPDGYHIGESKRGLKSEENILTTSIELLYSSTYSKKEDRKQPPRSQTDSIRETDIRYLIVMDFHTV